ncbi:MAG: hypothetical protein AB2605_02605 [Candidatus Thiodiazotropha sp.]
MSDHNPLAQEMTAQIQLGLFGTVGKLARQLRSIDRIAPQLKAGGLVRKLRVDRDVRRRSIGIAVAHRRIHAFSGLLYGVGALAHELSTAGADIAHTGQRSRMDVGDMSLLESDRRLKWKTYGLVYDLLEEVFESNDLPDMIILDAPLVMGKAVYAQVLEESETDAQLKGEIRSLRERADGFWDQHIDRCFPFAKDGPRVVTLDRGRFGSLLRLLERKGGEISPDPIDPVVEQLIGTDWGEILSVGIDRVLRGILVPEHRTAAFDREQDRLDKEAFPKALVERGSVAFHYLTGMRGDPVQVTTLGAANVWADNGGAEALDELAADLVALTYFDHRRSVPLPLWYAQQGVEVVKKKGILEFYRREALRAMREEQVDQAWLTGWDEE